MCTSYQYYIILHFILFMYSMHFILSIALSIPNRVRYIVILVYTKCRNENLITINLQTSLFFRVVR